VVSCWRPATERHLSGSLGLVVGSEGEGLHDLTRKRCDILLQLPMRGRIESLKRGRGWFDSTVLAHLRRSSS